MNPRKSGLTASSSSLLTELRVLLPGVQVLFAFLLTVPFNTGFLNASTFHRLLLLVALLTTALAIGLLVAPAAQHRILFRAPEKRRLLWRSNLFAISGVLPLLAVAVVVSVLLVVDYLFQILVASICAGLVAAVLVSAWLVQPVIQRGVGSSSTSCSIQNSRATSPGGVADVSNGGVGRRRARRLESGARGLCPR
jgi:nitrate reductase NapE component